MHGQWKLEFEDRESGVSENSTRQPEIGTQERPFHYFSSDLHDFRSTCSLIRFVGLCTRGWNRKEALGIDSADRDWFLLRKDGWKQKSQEYQILRGNSWNRIHVSREKEGSMKQEEVSGKLAEFGSFDDNSQGSIQ
jgi:hypothetical protein